jgi:hypothetical protein
VAFRAHVGSQLMKQKEAQALLRPARTQASIGMRRRSPYTIIYLATPREQVWGMHMIPGNFHLTLIEDLQVQR